MRAFLLAGLAALAGSLSLMSTAHAGTGGAYELGSPAGLVHIDAGALQGVTADGIARFKGVPYAKPPVGVWRWRPPQRPDAWQGVRAADRYGSICMQKVVKDNGVGLQPASEDCLTLNVFTPQNALASAAPGAKLPVMVWIHGGGLINGSGTAELYDGTKLAEQGVVVVTINYRLGRFGFFAHPALTAETPKTYLANYGLMDQIAALQWVQRNITAFGGDPTNVTIFGESAGGYSVDRLMMIRETRGLFQKAISQSGAYSDPNLTLAAAERQGVAFARSLGVTGDDAAALRAISAATLVATGDFDAENWGAPVLDGRLLSEDAITAFGRGRTAKVPYMVGSNSLEFHFDTHNPHFKRAFKQTPEEIAVIAAAYGSKAAFDLHASTDMGFAEPARALARDHAISGSPTYLYRFSVLSAGAPATFKGAPHASDRQYVFQTLKESPWPTDARDAALAKTISAYWVAFAKTGDPNGGDRPHWPHYNSKDMLMDFTNDGPVAKATPDAHVLDAIAESYRNRPSSR